MSKFHSVAEADADVSDLIDRALRGEGVVITRAGAPVVEVKPWAEPATGRIVTQADIDWIVAHQIQPVKPLVQDAGALVSQMRDEDGH